MNMNRQRLGQDVTRQLARKDRARRAQGSVLAQAGYLGVLGLMLVLPMVAGAYLGNWLDGKLHGFSFSWTVSLILVGLALGIINVVWFIRSSWV
jgi:ATP synthase protein I